MARPAARARVSNKTHEFDFVRLGWTRIAPAGRERTDALIRSCERSAPGDDRRSDDWTLADWGFADWGFANWRLADRSLSDHRGRRRRLTDRQICRGGDAYSPDG